MVNKYMCVLRFMPLCIKGMLCIIPLLFDTSKYRTMFPAVIEHTKKRLRNVQSDTFLGSNVNKNS